MGEDERQDELVDEAEAGLPLAMAEGRLGERGEPEAPAGPGAGAGRVRARSWTGRQSRPARAARPRSWSSRSAGPPGPPDRVGPRGEARKGLLASLRAVNEHLDRFIASMAADEPLDIERPSEGLRVESIYFRFLLLEPVRLESSRTGLSRFRRSERRKYMDSDRSPTCSTMSGSPILHRRHRRRHRSQLRRSGLRAGRRERVVDDAPILSLSGGDDFGGKFVRGLLAIVAVLMNEIPIIAIAADFGVISSLLAEGADTFGGVGGLAGWNGHHLPPASHLPLLDRHDRFGRPRSSSASRSRGTSAHFQFGEIWDFIRANLGDYLLAILIYVVASIIAGFGIIACGIGVLFTSFWVIGFFRFPDGNLWRGADLQAAISGARRR